MNTLWCIGENQCNTLLKDSSHSHFPGRCQFWTTYLQVERVDFHPIDRLRFRFYLLVSIDRFLQLRRQQIAPNGHVSNRAIAGPEDEASGKPKTKTKCKQRQVNWHWHGTNRGGNSYGI